MEIRGLKMQDLWGIKIVSTASAFPSPGRFVSNSEIHKMRFGNNWEEVFKSKNYNIDFSKQEKFEIIQFLYNYSIKLLSKLIIISCCTFGRFLILVE